MALGVGLLANTVSPDGIPVIGKYRSLSGGNGPVVPPTAEPGDPPFIDIARAQLEFDLGDVLFIDARDESEFACGTIPGSVNIPFEYLPDDDLEGYFESVLGKDRKDRLLITYCSGEECDLSLHLARNLQDLGYTNVVIFFGGSREWEKYDLGLERGPECEN